MNSIRVWTLRWRLDGERFNEDVATAIESEMELRAVHDFESPNCQVRAHEEPYGLHYIKVDDNLIIFSLTI